MRCVQASGKSDKAPSKRRAHITHDQKQGAHFGLAAGALERIARHLHPRCPNLSPLGSPRSNPPADQSICYVGYCFSPRYRWPPAKWKMWALENEPVPCFKRRPRDCPEHHVMVRKVHGEALATPPV